MKLAISVGDINGVGIEIALKAHDEICKFCEPVYFINRELLNQAAEISGLNIPENFKIYEVGKNFKIKPGKVSKKSGKFSFLSFTKAVEQCKKGKFDAVCTLPINKEAWKKADIKFVGHTDYLSAKFHKNAIMMLGCDELFTALFTDHTALKKVSSMIKTEKFAKFLLNLYKCTKFEKIGVLSFNPHASDNGVIGGSEEKKIKKAINKANNFLQHEIFFGPLVPDTAFTSQNLKNFNRIAAIYHDQGLTPLKSLFFEKSINVSLNLPIIRTSVDHGTAFDIAYKGVAKISSFIEAASWAVKLYETKNLKN